MRANGPQRGVVEVFTLQSRTIKGAGPGRKSIPRPRNDLRILQLRLTGFYDGLGAGKSNRCRDAGSCPQSRDCDAPAGQNWLLGLTIPKTLTVGTLTTRFPRPPDCSPACCVSAAPPTGRRTRAPAIPIPPLPWGTSWPARMSRDMIHSANGVMSSVSDRGQRPAPVTLDSRAAKMFPSSLPVGGLGNAVSHHLLRLHVNQNSCTGPPAFPGSGRTFVAWRAPR